LRMCDSYALLKAACACGWAKRFPVCRLIQWLAIDSPSAVTYRIVQTLIWLSTLRASVRGGGSSY